MQTIVINLRVPDTEVFVCWGGKKNVVCRKLSTPAVNVPASLLALERLGGLADGHPHRHAALGRAARRLVHGAALVQLALNVDQPPQHEPEEERGAADERVALLVRVRVRVRVRLELGLGLGWVGD